MTMYKILLLTDFSPASRQAMAFAQALFADTPTQFCLLHTFSAEPTEGFTGTFLLAEQRQVAEASLRDFYRTVTQSSSLADHTYQTRLLLGSPVRVVEALLAQEQFDLVVVSATGSGLAEFFGSVATGMVRSANTNVLVVPVSTLIHPLKRVVLATDYRSVNGADSFVFVKDLVERKAAQLTLLTIETFRRTDLRAAELSSQYVLKAFENVPIDTYSIHNDDVRQGIRDYLDTHSVDLLVLLPHHKRFIDLLLNKSLSRSIAYNPCVPLLTLYDSTIASPATRIESTRGLDEFPFTTSR